MKGTMTYAELLEACQAVIDHQRAAEQLLGLIKSGKVKPVPKSEFDQWVEAYCDSSGKTKGRS